MPDPACQANDQVTSGAAPGGRDADALTGHDRILAGLLQPAEGFWRVLGPAAGPTARRNRRLAPARAATAARALGPAAGPTARRNPRLAPARAATAARALGPAAGPITRRNPRLAPAGPRDSRAGTRPGCWSDCS